MIQARVIAAILFRHIMAFRRPGWFFESAYGTALDVVLFGFMGVGLMFSGETTAAVLNVMIGSVALWYVVVRGAVLMGSTLREELDDTNLVALVVTGLGPVEWLCASMVIGLIGSIVALVLAIITVWVVFGYNLLCLGWSLFYAGLALTVSAWVVGACVLCLVLVFGKRSVRWIHPTCWAFLFTSNVYCSLSSIESLPYFVRQLPSYLPMSYVFDGLRALALHATPIAPALVRSCVLSAVYLVLLGAFFCWRWQCAKRRGLTRLEVEW